VPEAAPALADAAASALREEDPTELELAGIGDDIPEVSRLVFAPKDERTAAMLKIILAFSYANEC
jgi:hypothetical protein